MATLNVGCGDCPLGGPWVGPRGSALNSDIAVIGEAPGIQELVQGDPFVGPSGKLLDTALQRAGLPQGLEGLYLTNSLMCKPKETPPSDTLIKTCQSRMHAELASRQTPFKLIIVLGNSAMHSMLNDFKLRIGNERGKLYETPMGPAFMVYHPAAILRTPQLYKHMLEDLTTAVDYYKTGVRRNPGVTLHTIVTPETIEQAIKGLMAVPLVAADVETSSLDFMDGYLLSLGVAYKANRVLIFPGSLLEPFKNLFAFWFTRQTTRFIWHNGKFDVKWLRRMGIPANIDEDTMLMHYALDEIKGTHDLGQLARIRLGAPDYKKALKPWLPNKDSSYALVPPKVLYRYQAFDCDFTLQLYYSLLHELNLPGNKGLPELYRNTLLPAANFLSRVEEFGMKLDMNTLKRIDGHLQGQIQMLYQQLMDYAAEHWNSKLYVEHTGAKKEPLEFNPGSPNQMHWLLYRKLGLKPGKGYPTNTAEATLKNLVVSHPIVDALLEYRGVMKEKSTYVDGALRDKSPDDKIHTTFNIHGTVTGRLSSSKEESA